jgi:hypothetical protein
MPEGSSIGPRKLAQSDLDIPSAGLTDVSYWQILNRSEMMAPSRGATDVGVLTTCDSSNIA